MLTWSILVYAFSAAAAGFATSLPALLVFRCTTFIGVCVEFVAAVAWLAELFSEPKRREAVLGYTQAFSSLGGVMVSGMAALIAKTSASLPAIYGAHDNWRYLLISGLIPAIPLIIIRPFLPESPVWLEKRTAGTLKRPSLGELFIPEYRKATLIAAAMFACSLGAAFGAIQQIRRSSPRSSRLIVCCRRLSASGSFRAPWPTRNCFRRWEALWGDSCWRFWRSASYRGEICFASSWFRD